MINDNISLRKLPSNYQLGLADFMRKNTNAAAEKKKKKKFT